LIIGDGELKEQIESITKELSITDNVLLPGERRDVLDIYYVMDIFILSSLWEGLPYALLEAMSRWIPVIGTDVPGIEDVVENNKTGLLVKPEDPEELSCAILNLINNRSKVKKLGVEGKKYVINNFQLKMQIEKLQDIYINTLKAKN
jgi:glycosyltransferase involved in cell wall biosynthesis